MPRSIANGVTSQAWLPVLLGDVDGDAYVGDGAVSIDVEDEPWDPTAHEKGSCE